MERLVGNNRPTHGRDLVVVAQVTQAHEQTTLISDGGMK